MRWYKFKAFLFNDFQVLTVAAVEREADSDNGKRRRIGMKKVEQFTLTESEGTETQKTKRYI